MKRLRELKLKGKSHKGETDKEKRGNHVYLFWQDSKSMSKEIEVLELLY